MSAARSPASLYQFQKTLPKLPVPSLDETLSTYLQSVRPHLNDVEFERTCKAVEEFKKPGGVGQELQKRLIAHDNSKSNSWLIDWWNSYAYMAYRDPVVVYVNYFFCFNDDKKLLNNPAGRAATLITGAMEFRKLVVSEKLEPETARSGALCSHQYRFLFNSTRIPKLPEDVTRTSDPATNNHIVVLRKNQFFKLDLVKRDGTQLSTAEIETQLKKIIQLAGPNKDVPVGALTTENRDVWAKVREDLLAISPINGKSLDAIETAAFVVCLDDTKPVTYDDVSRACWTGDGRNRFFDKSLQFIVFENGKAGFNGEHSMMDATPTSRLCDWVLDNLAKNKIDHGSASVSSDLAAPQKLEFKLSSNLTKAIVAAEEKFDKLVDQHELKVVAFEGYGKNLIKKFQVSPDAFAQMAIQLAYYKMYGVCKPTYESAQTRKYAYGRTETCRSVTVESVAWVKAMEDPSVPLKVKGEMGRKAIASQTAYMAKAVEGRGVDRHLLGLRLLIKPDEPKPSLFADPAYSQTCHWNLSTSQITSEHYNGYGWGEAKFAAICSNNVPHSITVVPDGYGVAYMVKENSLHFNLVSLKLQNETFRHYFFEALREMKDAFEVTIPPPKAKL
ncbi:Carnitine O-acetyltransferase mitochondrial [Blyttiomyces sp. JEL0837]|nr:Carnitine O-acetyltransferase mitochondrial [Blyttiomyces sp. JEL0837]